MKKKIVLLPLAALLLTGCANLGFSNNGQQDQSREPRSQVEIEDVAIKLLNSVTVFPALNDDLDLDDYADFDPGCGYTLQDFTFTSSNPNVIRIENYHAKCIGEGYAEVSVTGPTIKKALYLSFFVGSIAGTYTPDMRELKNKVVLEIGEADPETFECEVNVRIADGTTYNREAIEAYSGKATFVKDRSPFLNLTFEDNGPAAFYPLTAYLSTFGLDAEDFNLQTNVYGLMSYDEEWGLELKMMLNGFPVSLYAAE